MSRDPKMLALSGIAVLVISAVTLNYVDKHCSGAASQQKLVKTVNIAGVVIGSLLLLSLLVAHTRAGGRLPGVQARLRRMLGTQ